MTLETTYLNFTEGLAKIKDGNKVVAVVVDRIVRYKLQHHQFRFLVEIPRFHGAFDCVSLDEVDSILKKYAI